MSDITLEYAGHKCFAESDTKENRKVSTIGTELTLGNCEQILAILDESNEAANRGDTATYQRLRREAEAYEIKAEVENMQAALDSVATHKKGAAPVDTLDKTRQRNYEVCLKANAEDPKVCNVLLQGNK